MPLCVRKKDPEEGQWDENRYIEKVEGDGYIEKGDHKGDRNDVERRK